MYWGTTLAVEVPLCVIPPIVLEKMLEYPLVEEEKMKDEKAVPVDPAFTLTLIKSLPKKPPLVTTFRSIFQQEMLENAFYNNPL